MSEPIPVTEAPKLPKERTIVAFFLGVFFGRFGLPLAVHSMYIYIIVALLVGKPMLLSLFQPEKACGYYAKVSSVTQEEEGDTDGARIPHR